MKLTSLSKSVKSIGLIAILSTIQGISLVQTAQAQAKESTTACSAAYFDDPDYMYNPSFNSRGKEQAAVDKFNADPARIKRFNDIWAMGSTFSVALDAPVGYIAKTVNGKPIVISLKLTKEMDSAASNANRDPMKTRQRVVELNRKYAKYATFGQQINLILSPEQSREYTKLIREISAYTASVLTPQQKLEEQKMVRKDFNGSCPPLSRPSQMRDVVLQVGARPDLDKRLREAKTGTTLFK